ncbi:hypothetical protein MTR67_048798 [Solanum verrucosum]|uniref:glutamate carboxypeptidase II n=1 Tax=Solanum verrucosum TaxID=315347 RepID=A0AAF0ZZM4_SOLVR|nr:hypothetical protein MTR67_048798 [Solanum verrucosum]
MATVHNVFAVIRGSQEPDRFVLLGNHRDAWTYGAVDPNSGTAALLDIARRYALLMRLGWNPRRTIILCSWDAEEFGMVGNVLSPEVTSMFCCLMIGSTEWVEQNLVNLGSKSVAYLNVDCAVQGPGFFPSTTPQFDNLLTEITKKVNDPDSEGMTLYERWTAANRGIKIQRLSGVDSDFAPFLHHAGVPSVDLYYGRDFPVYHTAFDSYNWMVNFGDPFFQRHVAVTGVWGLLALRLAEDPILPFNYLPYAAELQDYTRILSKLLEGRNISLHPITAATQELAAAAKETLDEAKATPITDKNILHMPPAPICSASFNEIVIGVLLLTQIPISFIHALLGVSCYSKPQCIEEATEGGHCNTIQATQGTEIISSLSKLIEQYSCIVEMSITLPPHRGPFDHKISIKDASNPVSKRPYKYPGVKKDIIEKLVIEMLDQGKIAFKHFGGVWKLKEDKATDEHTALKRRILNDRLMFAERGFLDAEGLQGRPWFKHMVYGPRNDGESELDFFPGIANAISKSSGGGEQNAEIQHEIWRTARAIQRAAHGLKGELIA